MPENKLELKVIRDSNQQAVELDAMSIEAALAFSKMIESLAKIIESTPGAEGIKIQITRGSAVASAPATDEQIKVIHDTFNEVSDNNCTDTNKVEPWRWLQDLIKTNGLDYEVGIFKGIERVSILPKIKNSKRFITKSPRTPKTDTLTFLKGTLIEAGGANPNIHIKTEEGNIEVVSCNMDRAKRASQLLYDTIYISAWAHGRPGVKPEYTYCDTYRTQEKYDYYCRFITRFNSFDDKFRALISLHDECRELLDGGDFLGLKKLMKLFNHESVDINDIKTILVITKEFKGHEIIGPMRTLLNNLMNVLLTKVKD